MGALLLLLTTAMAMLLTTPLAITEAQYAPNQPNAAAHWVGLKSWYVQIRRPGVGPDRVAAGPNAHPTRVRISASTTRPWVVRSRLHCAADVEDGARNYVAWLVMFFCAVLLHRFCRLHPFAWFGRPMLIAMLHLTSCMRCVESCMRCVESGTGFHLNWSKRAHDTTPLGKLATGKPARKQASRPTSQSPIQPEPTMRCLRMPTEYCKALQPTL
jgi:hypothetical protein